MATFASRSMTAARSLADPFTLRASAALARPGPIALASSAPETGPGNLRTEPSGSVTATGAEDSGGMVGGSRTWLASEGLGLTQGERGGSLLHPDSPHP